MENLGTKTQNVARDVLTRRSLLRTGLALASASACPSWLRADSRQQSWTIGNGLIERVLNFNPMEGLSTRKLASARIEYVAPGKIPWRMGQEFSFLCNGHVCSGTNGAFGLVDHREAQSRNAKTLTVCLRHKQLPLEVDVVYCAYDGHPAIRKHLILRDTGKDSLHLSHMNIEALDLSLGAENEVTLLTQYGTVPREIFYTGRSEDAGLLLANDTKGNGIALISEVPGYMKRTEIGGWRAADTLGIGVMYDTDLMPYERTLEPGETFKTASSSLVIFRNGDGFNDPHWVMPSYGAKVLERRIDADGAPWIYNTWEPFERRIEHDTTMQLIEAAGAMGMDIFTIDDGWQQEYGDNKVNLKSFPEGLGPILNAVEGEGMRLGLWSPLAAIGTDTEAYREHRECASRDRGGNVKTTGTMAGEKVVMCMASGYREAAAARLNNMIGQFRLAYVKLDLTTIFNAYGEAPGCWAKGHDHGDWAESLGRIYEGISYVTAKIYEKHPDVLVDLTFELWGQKHLIDAGLLAAGDLDWLSNVDDREINSAGPIQARQLLYSHAATMPAEAMLIGNIHAEQPSIEESFATAIGSAPLLLGDLRKLTVSDLAWYGEKIRWFKQFRRQHKISESFFPMGSWQQTKAAKWDGFARMARSGNGVIALFRNKSGATKAEIELRLLPSGSYKLKSVISGRDLGIVSSDDFARGVAIGFEEEKQVEILEVTSVHG